MRARSIGIALATLTLVACATTLPPAVPVSNLASLAGTYSGTMEEKGHLQRSTRLVVRPDGGFELTASDPAGFRTLGVITLGPDGTLRYRYDELKGRGEILTGRGTVHEGEGKRAIVLTHDDGTTANTVWKSLP